MVVFLLIFRAETCEHLDVSSLHTTAEAFTFAMVSAFAGKDFLKSRKRVKFSFLRGSSRCEGFSGSVKA